MRILDEKEVQERKNRLLQTVIFEYIRTAHPVSSGAIAETDGMNLSSATVRNMLHQLEDEGYLEHPHTSAGKIPTDKGYRYYVDYLINLREHLLQEEQRIQKEYAQKQKQIEDVMSQTSRVLAYLSHQAGFVLQPKLEESRLQRLELIPLEAGRVLMVLVASNGLVRHKIVEDVSAAAAGQMRTLAKWINTQFKDNNLREFCLKFSHEAEEKLLDEKEALKELCDIFGDPIQSIASELKEEGLLLDGASNVLKALDVSMQPRYLQDVASTFENREQLTALIRKEVERKGGGKNEVAIRIGRESGHPIFEQLALVSKSFETEDHTMGFLGIIGPKRMEYARMMALVENIQTALQKLLSNQKKEKLSDRGKQGK